MDNLMSMTLEAHHAERNHHRRYEIQVGLDLFNLWTATITYGRVGQGGQSLRFADASPQKLQAMIRHRLGRRLSAPRRIGCEYRLINERAVAGFDLHEWHRSLGLSRFDHQGGHSS